MTQIVSSQDKRILSNDTNTVRKLKRVNRKAIVIYLLGISWDIYNCDEITEAVLTIEEKQHQRLEYFLQTKVTTFTYNVFNTLL
jgi:hypothetical protein